MVGISVRTPLTTASVDVLPLERIGSRAEWRPSRRTRLVWGMKPSWTNATSSHVDEDAVDVPDRDVVQIIEHLRAAVDPHVILAGSHLRGAGWKDDVLGEDGIGDVAWREAADVKCIGVEIHADDARFPP